MLGLTKRPFLVCFLLFNRFLKQKILVMHFCFWVSFSGLIGFVEQFFVSWFLKVFCFLYIYFVYRMFFFWICSSRGTREIVIGGERKELLVYRCLWLPL